MTMSEKLDAVHFEGLRNGSIWFWKAESRHETVGTAAVLAEGWREFDRCADGKVEGVSALFANEYHFAWRRGAMLALNDIYGT